MSVRNNLIRNGVQFALRVFAWLARRERFNRITQTLMHGMAKSAVRGRNIVPAGTGTGDLVPAHLASPALKGNGLH